MKPTVYIIAGPTATGKTAIAISLARHLGTAIISADSRQCYHNMCIGTSMPSREERQEVKHYFIDEFPVTRSLTAGDYETLALQYLDEIFAAHNTAVVCGGTGLYIKALCEGLDDMPEADPAIVQQVTDDYEKEGLPWLQHAVANEDPEFYRTGEIQNPSRLVRALSFIRTTGNSITTFRTQTRKQREFHIIKIGLDLPRPLLYARINARVDKMMEQGLLEEVKQLLPYRDLKNLQTVGYAELFDFLDGKCSLAEAVDKIKQHTRNYAKRQITWFRKDDDIHWLSADGKDILEKIMSLK